MLANIAGSADLPDNDPQENLVSGLRPIAVSYSGCDYKIWGVSKWYLRLNDSFIWHKNADKRIG